MKEIYYGIKNKNIYLMLVISIILMFLGIFIFLLYEQNIGLLFTGIFGGIIITLIQILENGIVNNLKFNLKDRIRK